jgi:Ni,Fe-hydrogenase III large subunit
MDPDKLDLIEEAYENSIGKDAKVIRALINEVRRLQRELETLADSI